VLKIVLNTPAMQQHVRCIGSSAGLACTVYTLLLPATAEAAVVLQLPPDRHPESWDLAAAAELAAGFSSLAMGTGVEPLWAALESGGCGSGSGSGGGGRGSGGRGRGSSSGGRGSSSGSRGSSSFSSAGLMAGLRFVQSSAKLVCHMPFASSVGTQAQAGSDFWQAYWLTAQLSCAIVALKPWSQQEGSVARALTFQHQLQRARLLQQALPRLAGLVRMALAALGRRPTATSGAASFACTEVHLCSLCTAMESSLELLQLLCYQQSSKQPLSATLEALPVWYDSAAAALQALPAAAEAASRMQPNSPMQGMSAPSLSSANELAGAVEALVLAAGLACGKVGSSLQAQPLLPGSMPVPGTVATAAKAAWQLHTAGCRLVCWLAEESSRIQLLPHLHAPAAQLSVLQSAPCAFKLLMCMSQRSQQAASAHRASPDTSEACPSHTLLTR